MGSTSDDDTLRADLLRLELALAERRGADLPGGYPGVLHDAFRETGASGRGWTRDEMLVALAAAQLSEVAIRGFEVQVLADGVVLATYEILGARPARRASIWVLDGSRWRIRYHQGTLL